MFPFIHRRTIEQVHTAGERFHPGVCSNSAGKGKGTQSIQWKSTAAIFWLPSWMPPHLKLVNKIVLIQIIGEELFDRVY